MAHAGFAAFLDLVFEGAGVAECTDSAFTEGAYAGSGLTSSIAFEASSIKSSVALSLLIFSRCSAALSLKF